MFRILHALILLAFAGYLTFVAFAQRSSQGQMDSLLERGVENRSRIVSLESRMSAVEGQGLLERLTRLETKVEQIEWYIRLVIAGVAALIVERAWGVVTRRRRKDDEG